jgi:hypothetical protein
MTAEPHYESPLMPSEQQRRACLMALLLTRFSACTLQSRQLGGRGGRWEMYGRIHLMTERFPCPLSVWVCSPLLEVHSTIIRRWLWRRGMLDKSHYSTWLVYLIVQSHSKGNSYVTKKKMWDTCLGTKYCMASNPSSREKRSIFFRLIDSKGGRSE